MDTMYLPIKFVHIASVIAFLGNITTGLFWHAIAARTRAPKLLAHTMAGIIHSDRILTIPGVVLIIATGTALAHIAGLPLLRTPWLFWSLMSFLLSGLVFVFFLVPMQRQLLAIAQAGIGADGFDWPAYQRLSRRWEIWGVFALLAPIAALMLMVLKPTM